MTAYALLAYAAFAFLWPLLLIHPKLRGGLGRRLGFYPRDYLAAKSRPRIWMHGASAGDILALRPMIPELRRRLPGCTIVMSAMTRSGATVARSLGDEVDAVTLLPVDLPGATDRAMRAIAPDLLVLEYTEMWPSLLAAARRRGARVAVTNGRFSASRLAGYRRLFRLSGAPHRKVDLYLMRDEGEAERAILLGVPRERLHVTGSTKFDALSLPLPAGAALREAIGPGPILVAGSTHEGEEALLAPVFARLRAAHPALRFLIAPRYVHRAPAVARLLAGQGFSTGLRSAGAAAADVVILDTIGELRAAYALGVLAFVGGSFTARGGQNVLEPAASGVPVLFGPGMRNFADAVAVLAGRGGIQVETPAELERVALDLLSRPAEREALGEAARRAVLSVRGASARNAEHLAALLSAKAAA